MSLSTPVQVDTNLAALYGRLNDNQIQTARSTQSALSMAGAAWYYRGKQRVTDMTLEEAVTKLSEIAAANADDTHGHTQVGRGYCLRQARETLSRLADCEEARQSLLEEIQVANAAYTGWSRFFLVTSSAGHIHSSMHCSTCRPTTGYGWLPEMSGRTEADCVAEHGPALCTVCFPSAPVAWTTAKLTKSQAEKAAA